MSPSEFIERLHQADIVELDSSGVLYRWTTSKVTGEPGNQVVRFTWDDDEGQSYAVILDEAGIAEGEWDRNTLRCVDTDGDPVSVMLYRIVPLT